MSDPSQPQHALTRRFALSACPRRRPHHRGPLRRVGILDAALHEPVGAEHGHDVATVADDDINPHRDCSEVDGSRTGRKRNARERDSPAPTPRSSDTRLGHAAPGEVNGPNVNATPSITTPASNGPPRRSPTMIHVKFATSVPLNGQRPAPGASGDDVVVILGPDAPNS